jgi:peroxiredoxin
MALPAGSKAPDFSLKSKTAAGLEDVKLSDRLGQKNVVLLFFPAAFTGVCTQEMCSISGGLKDYEGLNAEVIGVSVDSPFAQEAWAQKEGITFPLVSDYDKQVIRAYDVVIESLAGIGVAAQRAAFVIDKNGVIQYAEGTPTPKDLPDFEAVKAALGKLG